MDITALREQVCEANQRLVANGLVTLSFGNASAVDRDAGVMVIKPSGVAYEGLTPAQMVLESLDDGRTVEDNLRPSSDTPTHLVLYRAFPEIGGVVHTHSTFAAAWAQAGKPIPVLGTTHADHFNGPVPVTRRMTADEIDGAYEAATGDVIVETIRDLGLAPREMPAALVFSHGPFTWGRDPAEAVSNAVALEAVAEMAYRTLVLDPASGQITPELLARHFSRKHGAGAYYGQPDQHD